jgi:uncharacterized membrane protein
MTLLLALAIGIVAGLRTMTAPAAVSWAAHLGWLPLDGTRLAWLGAAYTPWIFTVMAIGEFIGDQLPWTPSRTVPSQFGARLVSGTLAGVAIGLPGGDAWLGGLAGAIGALVGTLGGAKARGRLARAFGNDHPAAFIEDAVAIGAAWFIVRSL